MKVVTMHASAQETAGGQTGEFNITGRNMSFYLNATAITTSLDVTIQAKDPVSGAWFTVITFTQLVAAGGQRSVLADIADGIFRVSWTLVGNATFSVSCVHDRN